MLKAEYTKMFELEDTHFWFVGKRYFVDSVLARYKQNIKNILDLGSGTGGMTKYLEKYGKVVGIEKYDYAISLAKTRGVHIKKEDLNKFRVENNYFDLVTLFDVLYHQNINHESEILKRANSALKQGGYLLITDSALEILTSQHDVVTHGKRRYSLDQMKKIVERQNFKVLKASYVYFSIFPVIFLKRMVIDKIFKSHTSDVKPVSPFINAFVLSILKIESFLLSYISFPIGTSIVIFAVKK